MAESKTPDLSSFGQYFTRPIEARAKKLKKEKEYEITINGVPDKAIGRPGDWDVYVLKKNGAILRNEPYTTEIFEDKFGEKDEQGELIFKNQPKDSDEEGEE